MAPKSSPLLQLETRRFWPGRKLRSQDAGQLKPQDVTCCSTFKIQTRSSETRMQQSMHPDPVGLSRQASQQRKLPDQHPIPLQHLIPPPNKRIRANERTNHRHNRRPRPVVAGGCRIEKGTCGQSNHVSVTENEIMMPETVAQGISEIMMDGTAEIRIIAETLVEIIAGGEVEVVMMDTRILSIN